MSQICCLYEIWVSESSGRITWLVDSQMQRDEYLSSVTRIGLQIGQLIGQKMMIIVIMIFRMIVVTDNVKNDINGGNNSSNSNNKYQMGLTIQEEIMVQGATLYRRRPSGLSVIYICYLSRL